MHAMRDIDGAIGRRDMLWVWDIVDKNVSVDWCISRQRDTYTPPTRKRRTYQSPPRLREPIPLLHRHCYAP